VRQGRWIIYAELWGPVVHRCPGIARRRAVFSAAGVPSRPWVSTSSVGLQTLSGNSSVPPYYFGPVDVEARG
jgi:hypothetical protein